MARWAAAVTALSAAALCGLLWGSLELTLAGAWSREHALPVLACSLVVAGAFLLPAALLARCFGGRGTLAVRLVFFEAAGIAATVLALWGYLEYSGKSAPWSARGGLILAVACVGALVPAAALAWLAGFALARTSARLRAALAALALLSLILGAAWLVTSRRGTVPERWRGLPAARAGEANVVLLIADTLRGDHVSPSGYARPTTPNVAALGGALFTGARSVSNWTRPTVTTMISGAHPETHGVQRITSTLPAELPLVTEAFAAAGFATAFLTANPNTSAVFGFDRGCDVFFDAARHPLARLLPTTLGQIAARTVLRFERATRLNVEVLRFLERVQQRRFFLVVHYNDPHTPYAPAPPFDRLFGEPRRSPASRDPVHVRPTNEAQRQAALALYDGEIAALDQAVRELVDELGRRGLLARTALVLASDHGEEFAEHGGYGHGQTLFEEILRVLLLVRPAGEEHSLTRFDASVSLLDVAPTLLDLGRVAAPPGLPGRSLLPFLAGADPPGLPVLASAVLPSAVAWCDGPSKLILDMASGKAALFDLEADPLERDDLASAHGPRVEELRAALLHQLGQYQAQRLQSSDSELSPALAEELRALGYAR